ncbi:rCG22872 [Rattus norvegicus]|uniref:RCG22872 n=1 Tax=Rattus norvegicus TaxID=10116 RepID=A6KP77_RAT|nr:rCG22872 [Rattus norvegicus]
MFTSDLRSTVGPSLLVFSTSILQGSATPLPEDTPNFLPIPRPLSNLF